DLILKCKNGFIEYKQDLVKLIRFYYLKKSDYTEKKFEKIISVLEKQMEVFRKIKDFEYILDNSIVDDFTNLEEVMDKIIREHRISECLLYLCNSKKDRLGTLSDFIEFVGNFDKILELERLLNESLLIEQSVG